VSRTQLVLLSAGGTGGHMTPAGALAHDLISRGYRVEILTDSRGEKYKNMFTGIKMHVISAGTLRPGVVGKITGAAGLGLGIAQALKIVKSLKPAVVVGFGGYPSFPGVFAAQHLGVPSILHEQNAIIGKANLMLANKATRIALSIPSNRGLDDIDQARVSVTGNPVRPEIAALYTQPYSVPTQDGTLRILIVGGSLGASVFSKIIPDALAKLPAAQKARLEIIQQCRESDFAETKDKYKAAGINASLSTFFEDMAGEFARAHLVIARSGASTVAEVTTAGRPAIFVPYPHHKDQQQKMNADAVADAGGAWVMTEEGFTVEALLARIETFLQNPQILFRAAEKATACARPDAARKLGNLVTEIASGWEAK
jgi:UDP-N-acetylglucosamine--N-acetylmuramyl-(pentapeptide) pyrophosphoryl-undecaprenol N-acetylglucosamine transferase